MKNLMFLFISFTISFLNLTAQENQYGLTSGKIVFEISYATEKMDEQTKAMLPAESIMHFKGHMTRIDISMAMGTTSIISNNESGKGTMLMDFMGNKIAMEIGNEESKNEKTPSFNVELLAGEKKIAGYNCKKAKISQTQNGEVFSFDVWYTKEISANNAKANGIKGIDGCMLEYEIMQNGTQMKMTTKSITAMDVKDELFVVPEGYTYTTQEDLKSMMGGGTRK